MKLQATTELALVKIQHMFANIHIEHSGGVKQLNGEPSEEVTVFKYPLNARHHFPAPRGRWTGCPKY